MKEVICIKLIKIEDIANVSQIAMSCDNSVTVVQGDYRIDAKSVLGLYLLDWSSKAVLVAEDCDIDKFRQYEVS